MLREAGKLISLVILLASGISIQAQDNVVDKIIWIVGDEAILKSDIERTRMMMLSGGGRVEGDPYCFIPEQLAMQKLFLDQAKIDSITVPDGNVSRFVMQQEKRVIENLGSKEKVEEYLQAPLSQLKEEWREEYKNNLLVEEVKKNIVGKKGNLTPSEVRKHYSRLSKDSLPYIPTIVEVQIITNEPKIPATEIDRVKGELRGYTDRVNSGESFSTLAIMYSDEPSAAQTGGEMGFRGRAEWVPEFSNMAFSLSDPKKVSNIVETEYGFHIIQLIERRGDLTNVRHILRQPKVSNEEVAKTISKMDSVVNFIKEGKFTFEDATSLSFDKDTRNNNGLMVNRNMESSNQGTPRFEMEDLPTEVSKVVANMKVGEVSAPFRMKLRNQKDVVAIVKLKTRVEQHVANVSDDYLILKDIVESRKNEEILKKWLQTKIKDTYVYIDEEWRNCDFQYSGWIKDEVNNKW